MRPPRLLLSAFTRQERHGVTSAITGAIQSQGGWIENHTAYSNLALTLHFTLPAENLPRLVETLMTTGLSFGDDGPALVKQPAESPAPNQDREIPCALSITFIHDEPDLRQIIPAVPG